MDKKENLGHLHIKDFEIGDIICWSATIDLNDEKKNVGIVMKIDKHGYLIVKQYGNVHKTYFLSPISATKISF